MKDHLRPEPNQRKQGDKHPGKRDSSDQERRYQSTDGRPTPPPPGTATALEMVYDAFDVKILAEVGSYRFGSITANLSNDGIAVPPHPATSFDEQRFLNLLRGSISITSPEKWRLIEAIPTLNQGEVNSVIGLLEKERQGLLALSPKHLKELQNKERMIAEEWRDLQVRSSLLRTEEAEST